MYDTASPRATNRQEKDKGVKWSLSTPSKHIGTGEEWFLSFLTLVQDGSENFNAHVSAIVSLELSELLRRIWLYLMHNLAGRLDNSDFVLSCQSVKHLPGIGSRLA